MVTPAYSFIVLVQINSDLRKDRTSPNSCLKDGRSTISGEQSYCGDGRSKEKSDRAQTRRCLPQLWWKRSLVIFLLNLGETAVRKDVQDIEVAGVDRIRDHHRVIVPGTY
jgi:hypothetical protein